jgi:hypothetical protein
MEMRRLISNLFGIRNSIARKKWSVQAGFRLLLCALQSREQSDVGKPGFGCQDVWTDAGEQSIRLVTVHNGK